MVVRNVVVNVTVDPAQLWARHTALLKAAGDARVVPIVRQFAHIRVCVSVVNACCIAADHVIVVSGEIVRTFRQNSF